MDKTLKVTYDAAVDAAYIYFADISPGGVARTYCCNTNDIGGMVNIDLDSEGRLLGIEVLQAKIKLPPQLLSDGNHR